MPVAAHNPFAKQLNMKAPEFEFKPSAPAPKAEPVVPKKEPVVIKLEQIAYPD
jgi:hypothetical protein